MSEREIAFLALGLFLGYYLYIWLNYDEVRRARYRSYVIETRGLPDGYEPPQRRCVPCPHPKGGQRNG